MAKSYNVLDINHLAKYLFWSSPSPQPISYLQHILGCLPLLLSINHPFSRLTALNSTSLEDKTPDLSNKTFEERCVIVSEVIVNQPSEKYCTLVELILERAQVEGHKGQPLSIG